MSEVETAVDGAEDALPDEPAKEPVKAEETQQEPSTAEDEPKPEKPKRNDGGFQRRINQLTYEKRELERRLAQTNQPKPIEPPDANTDPVAYVRHLAQEEARRLLEESRRSEYEYAQRQQFEETQRKFQTRADEFANDNPDFWDAVQALDASVQLAPEIVEVIGDSDLGPQLTYYLAQHMDEAAQLASLPPHIAAARIARIEAKLSAPRQHKPTNTPSPVPTLGGSAVVRKDPAKMTYAEYKAHRAKEST